MFIALKVLELNYGMPCMHLDSAYIGKYSTQGAQLGNDPKNFCHNGVQINSPCQIFPLYSCWLKGGLVGIRLATFNLARVFNKSLIKRDEPFSHWK